MGRETKFYATNFIKKCNFKNWEAIQESDVKFFAISMHLWYFHISTALETRLKTEL